MPHARQTHATALAGAAPGSRRVADALRTQQRLLADGTARLQAATVEDVHKGRVTARRLRSLLRTFRPLFDERSVRRYRDHLRSYARALGEVRESDVRRTLLIRLASRDPGISRAGFRRLSDELESARSAARDALRQRMLEPGWAELCRALAKYASSERLLLRRDTGLDEVLWLVDRAWRKPRRLIEAGPRDTDELHELRLALKHCRYALESVADVEPESTDRLMLRLRAAQDQIGEHRDLVMARHWVEAGGPALGAMLARRLGRLIDRRMDELRVQALKRSLEVLPAYDRWRRACRRIRRAGNRGRS